MNIRILSDYFKFCSKHRYFLIFGLSTAFWGNLGQSFLIAWFSHSFQQSFDLSAGEYGAIYSVATLTSGIIILYVGALLDHTSLARFTLFTALGLSFACGLLVVAPNAWWLALALFLLRFCGQGLMFHIAFSAMSRHFHRNRGKAISVVALGMPIGEALFPILLIVILTFLDWRDAWLLFGLSILLVYLPLALSMLNRSPQLRPELTAKSIDLNLTNSSDKNRSQVLADGYFWAIIPAVMSPAFIVTGLFVHQNVLLDSKSWDRESFALSFMVYAISHLLGSFYAGHLVDSIGAKKLIRFYLIPMLLALLILALPLQQVIFMFLFMFFAGATIGVSGPIVGALWVELYGSSNIASIRALVTSIMVISTAISPALIGWLIDIGLNFNSITYLICAYLTTAILLAVIQSQKAVP